MKKLLLLAISLLTINADADTVVQPKVEKPVKIYDHLNIDESRMLVLKGEVGEETTTPLIKKITELDEENNKPIYLIINSPGGSVVDGFALANAMDSAKSSIICAVDTEAYSMAAILVTFCDQAYIHRFATMMFHEASFGIRGSESTVSTRIEFILNYLNELHVHVAKNLGITTKDYRAKIKKEWWMTATQAAKQGLVTGIINNLKYKYEEPEKKFSIFFRGNNQDTTPGTYRYFDLQYIYKDSKVKSND